MTFPISDKEFVVFQEILEKLLGIKLTAAKRNLVASRLSSRIKALKLHSFTEYIEFLETHHLGYEEVILFINKITTNETYFFRETHHFNFLKKIVLENFISEHRKKFRIWSVACSTGEEPYSIAMTIREAAPPKALEIQILGTDINTEVLDKARKGVYSEFEMKKLPNDMKLKYFKKVNKNSYKIEDSIKEMVQFKRLNLSKDKLPIKEPLDVVFCRNVLIYFTEDAKGNLIRKIHSLLNPEGLLMLGTSESLFKYKNLFQRSDNSIYRKI